MKNSVFLVLLFVSHISYGQSSSEILNKHFNAIGGKEKLLSIDQIQEKRRIVLDQVGVSINSTLSVEIGKAYRLDIEASPAAPGKIELYSDGEAYIFANSKVAKPSQMRAQYLSNTLDEFPSPLLNGEIKVLGQEEFGESTCFVVQNQFGNKYWIDKATYLIVKSVTGMYHEELGQVSITIHYTDYKEIAGIKFPFEKHIIEYGQRLETVSLTVNPMLAASHFSEKGISGNNEEVQMVMQMTSPDVAAQRAFSETNSYFAAVEEMAAIESDYKDNTMLKDFYYDLYSTNLSIAGRYKEALEAKDKAYQVGDRPAKPINLQENKAYNALDEIASLAAQRQAVFVNEAHHVPQHRAFTHQLLQRLYDKGYRYFAAETLAPEDTTIIQQKDNVLAYINEPEYADLVRKALKIGYKIIPYEYTAAEYMTTKEMSEGGTGATQKEKISRREQGQAVNLKEKIFDIDQNAKVLVHAGYDHIIESQHMGYEMMAMRFKKMTGIDPLTIDQVGLMEKGTYEKSNPYYRYIIETLNPNAYTILKNSNGNYWVTEERNGKVDMQVIHPRLAYKNDRPNWKSLGGIRKEKTITINVENRAMAEVFVPEETNGVPIDRVPLSSSKSETTFYLPKGVFILKVTDNQGTLIAQKSITVE